MNSASIDYYLLIFRYLEERYEVQSYKAEYEKELFNNCTTIEYMEDIQKKMKNIEFVKERVINFHNKLFIFCLGI